MPRPCHRPVGSAARASRRTNAPSGRSATWSSAPPPGPRRALARGRVGDVDQPAPQLGEFETRHPAETPDLRLAGVDRLAAVDGGSAGRDPPDGGPHARAQQGVHGGQHGGDRRRRGEAAGAVGAAGFLGAVCGVGVVGGVVRRQAGEGQHPGELDAVRARRGQTPRGRPSAPGP
ncbi:hypothetical protein ACFQ60_10785 [Streptomyces zhihengii]